LKETELLILRTTEAPDAPAADQLRVMNLQYYPELAAAVADLREKTDCSASDNKRVFVELSRWQAYLRELEERAQRLSRQLASQRLLFAQSLHDIRGALTVLLGCTEVMLRSDDIGLKSRGLVRQLEKCSDHLSGLVGEILTLSQCDSDGLVLHLTATQLRTELNSFLEMYELSCQEKGLAFQCRLDVPEVAVVDAFRLRRALGNLIENAIKYTDKGALSIAARQQGETLEIRVSDTGPGVAPELVPRLFEPFQQDPAHPAKVGGFGLGLSVARRLARAMGGDVVLESSTLGFGSTFLLTIKVEAQQKPV
jgi:two-component system, sensor histidine kinase